MIKAIEFPGKEFENREELFKHLRENYEEIKRVKKATVKYTDAVSFVNYDKEDLATKNIDVEGFDSGYIYPVINTTNYMDSHNDVHVDGIWNKTVKEQQGKILYIQNHDLSVGSEIAYPKDVEMSVKSFTFKQLGYDADGTTEALIFKVAKEDILEGRAKDRIEKRVPSQHSVRMEYVDFDLAMNSDSDEDKEFKDNYDKYIGVVSNREKVDSQGYFFVVREAKVSKEGSMVVEGSNDITPMLYGKDANKDNEPTKVTQEQKGPSADTSNNQLINFYLNLK